MVSGEHFIDTTRALADLLAQAGEPDPGRLAAAMLPSDPLAYFQGGGRTAAQLQAAIAHAGTLDTGQGLARGILVPRAQAKVLVPLPHPPKIVCVARNFAEHAKEAQLEIPEIPILFARFASTLIAVGEPVLVPRVSEEVDWEGELALVIGTGGRHIDRQQAMEHVAGYTVFNDVSVRDYQFRVTQYTGGKNFASSGPIGPWITLAGEALNPHDLQITTTVNGEVMQQGNTRDFIFGIPEIIEHISEFIALEPGDIIALGTPAGVGFKRTPPVFLRHGDTVQVEIPGVGSLCNPVANEPLLEQEHNND